MSGKTARASAKRASASNPHRTLVVEDPLLTRAEVAEMLGTTARWVGRGYLPHIKLGKLVRYRRSDVLAYIEAQAHPAQNGG